MQLEDIVRPLVADPDNDIEEPEFHVRGTVECWVRVDATGTVTGFEFAPGSFEPSPPGSSFARDAGGFDDGPDIGQEENEFLAQLIASETWQLTRIDTDDGAVYYDK